MNGKKLAILVGGSDLFSGLRGISKGTVIIRRSILPWYDDVLAVNYNYFLDFGRALRKVSQHIEKAGEIGFLCLYGYSKGGDVSLQLARRLENNLLVNVLITIDVADGPWSGQVDRNVPGNVKRNINIFQETPNILRSHGAPAYGGGGTDFRNIDLTGRRMQGKPVSHSNIEILMVPQVIDWMNPAVLR